MKFVDLGLSPAILNAIAKQGYEVPSPIQAQAIPAVLEGKDVMAAAQTGTGKTAGFTLPLLQRLSVGTAAKNNQVRALVLTPTRELAAQVGDSITAYGHGTKLKSTVVFGGVKINPQMQKLRGGIDILVATPGRLLDLYQQNAIKFDLLEVLVLDEADRMLDMGFIHDIKKIMKLLPSKRQNLLFSATFSNDIRQLAKNVVNDPVEISVTPRNATAKSVEQLVHPVDKKQKSALLIHLVNQNDWQQVLVFSRTKHGANRLVTQLEKAGITAVAIHGNKSQAARTKALKAFKANDVRVMVATDIAARGIDIDQLPQVVNFDLPNVPEDYVHRIGRTGRAGASGHAVSLVSADEIQQLADIERLTKALIPREYVDDFIPDHDLPASKLDTRPPKPKKPKKNKPRQDSNQAAGESSNADSGKGRNPRRKASAEQAGSNRAGDSNRRGRNANRSTNNNSRNAEQQGARSSNEKDKGNRTAGQQRAGNGGRRSQGRVVDPEFIDSETGEINGNVLSNVNAGNVSKPVANKSGNARRRSNNASAGNSRGQGGNSRRSDGAGNNANARDRSANSRSGNNSGAQNSNRGSRNRKPKSNSNDQRA